MGFISDRLKAVRAGEDYVKHLRFPIPAGETATTADLNRVRKAIELTVYRGFMARLKGQDRQTVINEFSGKFWASLSAEQIQQESAKAEKSLANLLRALMYGYDRASQR